MSYLRFVCSHKLTLIFTLLFLDFKIIPQANKYRSCEINEISESRNSNGYLSLDIFYVLIMEIISYRCFESQFANTSKQISYGK